MSRKPGIPPNQALSQAKTLLSPVGGFVPVFWSLRGLRHQGGALGRNGLAVPHAKVFDFLLYATYQLDPAIATIARKAAIRARGARAGHPQGRLGVGLAATPHRQHAKLRWVRFNVVGIKLTIRQSRESDPWRR